MTDNETLIQVLEAGERRRAERRRFIQLAGSATLAVGVAACSGSSTPTPTPTPTATPTPTPTPTATAASDMDYLNFALSFEYLEAQYYAWATTGAGLAASLLTGTGTQGAVTGGAQVTFTDPLIGQYAREIAAGELAHVGFLRSMTGSAAVAQSAIDISSSATGGFTPLARAAGVVGAAATFDPYASDLNFLLGAFILEDVVVTAYKGLLPLFSSTLYSNAVAGILATEAHHAALIRSQLYALGSAAQTAAGQLSDARDALDGSADIDQGVVTGAAANITPADSNGIVFSRTPGQVLNIFYNNHAAVVGGGFFPAGINSTFLASSAAN